MSKTSTVSVVSISVRRPWGELASIRPTPRLKDCMEKLRQAVNDLCWWGHDGQKPFPQVRRQQIGKTVKHTQWKPPCFLQ